MLKVANGESDVPFSEIALTTRGVFMIDINLIRTNAELVKENIKKKFQEHKLPLVDEALALDSKRRALIAEGDALRSASTASRSAHSLCLRLHGHSGRC